MSLADDIVQDAIDLIERPDLRSLATRMLRRAVLEWHGCDAFDRDRVSLDIAVATTAVEYSDTLPERFRMLEAVEGLLADVVVAEAAQFKERRGEVLRDYFGYKHGKTWSLLGNNLNFRWDTNLDTLRLTYLGFPTWTTEPSEDDPDVELITTDSWIVREYDKGLLYATLMNMTMGVDKSAEATSWKNLAEQAKNELIRNYGNSGV
jgi:hypothetical protein